MYSWSIFYLSNGFHFLSLLLLNVFNKVGKVCIRFSFIRQRLSIIYISQLQVFFLNPLYLFCHMFSKINTDKYSTHMFAFIYIRHLHNRLNKCAKKSNSHFLFLSAKHRFSIFCRQISEPTSTFVFALQKHRHLLAKSREVVPWWSRSLKNS